MLLICAVNVLYLPEAQFVQASPSKLLVLYVPAEQAVMFVPEPVKPASAKQASTEQFEALTPKLELDTGHVHVHK